MPDIRMNRLYVFYLALLLSAGCAQIVAPTGGPKDVTPPKALKYTPENKSLHFNSHKIRIEFDEFIQLKSLDKQLVVSPPLKTQPIVVVKGKVLDITVKDTLQDNTTYTFNFGNAIADNNEGNLITNFQYVVSTGDHLDSLKLSGVVTDAFTGDVAKGAYVMLYSNLDDSAIYKKLPSYIGMVSDQGTYRIENIKAGTYRAIALAVPQGDYLYHPYAEQIGFKSGNIDIEQNDTVNFKVFMEEEAKLRMLKAKVKDRGEVMLAFNKPADSISIQNLNMASDKKPYTYIHYSVTRDTVFYWLNTPVLDSLRFIVYRNNKILDTAFVHSFPNNTQNSLNKKAKPVKLVAGNNAHDHSGGFDYHDPILFTFNSPVLSYNMSKVRLTQGHDTLKFTTDTTLLPLGFVIKPAQPFASDSSYKLTLLPGAFTDMYGNTVDTSITKFRILEPTFFGSLKFHVKVGKPGHYIFQLLNDKNMVYKQTFLQDNKTIYYEALLPGTYRVRIIQDDNNNGRWDAGNYLKGTQAEKVFYYSESINVRSNWDIEKTWDVK
jgi:hypothetical protein